MLISILHVRRIRVQTGVILSGAWSAKRTPLRGGEESTQHEPALLSHARSHFAQLLENHRPQLRNAAGAEREDHVPILSLC